MKYVNNAIYWFFQKLNLTEKGRASLSLTNLAVLVCVVKVAIAKEPSLAELGALLLSLMNYSHKRKENAQAEVRASQDVANQNLVEVFQKTKAEFEAKVASQKQELEAKINANADVHADARASQDSANQNIIEGIQKAKAEFAARMTSHKQELETKINAQAEELKTQGKVVEEAKSIMTAQKLNAGMKRHQL